MAYLNYAGLSYYRQKTLEYLQSKITRKELAFVHKKFKWINELMDGQKFDIDNDTTEAYSKTVPTGAKIAAVNKIGGKSVVMNQLITTTKDFAHTAWNEATDSSHKYLFNDNGNLSYVTGQTSLAVVGAEDKLIDLTKMFGAGREPVTVADAIAKGVPTTGVYNAGTLTSAEVDEIVSIGANLFNSSQTFVKKAYLNNDGSYFYLDVDVSWVSDYIQIKPNTNIRISNTYLSEVNQYSCWYDDNKEFISSVNTGLRGAPQTIISPNNAKFIKISISPQLVENFVMCYGTADIPFVPYVGTIETLAIPSALRIAHPLRSAGTVHDEYDLENMKHIQRVESRAYQEGDEDDTTVITDGTTTYYPLATPIETDISSYFDNPDMMLATESGGSLTFEQDGTYLQVPNDVDYAIKLTEVA